MGSLQGSGGTQPPPSKKTLRNDSCPGAAPFRWPVGLSLWVDSHSLTRESEVFRLLPGRKLESRIRRAGAKAGGLLGENAFKRASPFLMLLNAGALYVADGMGPHTQASSWPRGCLALVGGDSGLLWPVQRCSPCSPKQLEHEAFAETPPLSIPMPTPRGEEQLRWRLLG